MAYIHILIDLTNEISFYLSCFKDMKNSYYVIVLKIICTIIFLIL